MGREFFNPFSVSLLKKIAKVGFFSKKMTKGGGTVKAFPHLVPLKLQTGQRATGQILPAFQQAK